MHARILLPLRLRRPVLCLCVVLVLLSATFAPHAAPTLAQTNDPCVVEAKPGQDGAARAVECPPPATDTTSASDNTKNAATAPEQDVAATPTSGSAPVVSVAAPTRSALTTLGEMARCGTTSNSGWTTTSSAFTTIMSCTLTLAEPGVVYLSGSTSLGYLNGDFEARFNIAVDSPSGNPATDRWVNVYSDGADGTDKNLSSTLLAPVAAGSHTFYFLGARYAGSGTVQLYRPSFSVLFFPSSKAELLSCGVSSNLTWTTTNTSFQEIRSCSLTLPKNGFVYINATATAGLNNSDYEGRFRLGVDSVSGTASSDRWVNVYTDSGDGTDEAVVTSLLTSVSAGAHTFFFSGTRYAGTGTVQLYDPTLSVLYFPEKNVTTKVCGASGSDSWTNSTATYSTIRSCSMYVPSNSFAFMEASASGGQNAGGAGNEWEGQFRLGVDNSSGSSVFDRWVNVYNDSGDGTDRIVADSGLVDLAAGNHTFFFVGKRYTGAGTLRLYTPSLTVIVPNITPTITPIADQAIVGNSSTGTLPFTITTTIDPATVTITGSSSNPTLLPDANISLGGTGSNRTVTLTPAPGQLGTAEVTLLVDDTTLPISTTFTLQVTSPVSISAIPDQAPPWSAPVGPLPFTVTGATTVAATSSNSTLVPTANLTIDGAGNDRTITVTPVPGQSGITTITITASDGTFTATSSFTVTIPSLTAAISPIPNQEQVGGTQPSSIPFTITTSTDPATAAISVVSSDTSLVPNANIAVGGAGTNRTLTITPVAGRTGATTVTVTLNDPAGAVSTTFVFLVRSPITISPLSNQMILPATTAGPLLFTVTGATAVNVSSSNTNLVPTTNVVLTGSGENWSITVTPLLGQIGTTTITITASDGTFTETESFTLTVAPYQVYLPLVRR